VAELLIVGWDEARAHHSGGTTVLHGQWGSGRGTGILGTLIGRARESGLANVILNRRVDALPLHAPFGLVAEGDHAIEAGTVQRLMRLVLCEGSQTSPRLHVSG
jgi:hypothetical protein